MKKLSEKEKLKLLSNYFNEHSNSYKGLELERIIHDFGTSYGDHLTQIYYALDLLEDEENPYIGITQLIEKIYGLDINILEVGGGVYPALTNEIAKKQQSIGKGSITVYDPLLSKNVNIKKAILVKDGILRTTDFSKYDLVIGKEPCSATTILIDNCLEQKKDMLVSPCKCYNLLPEYIESDDDPLTEWYNYVKNYMDNYKNTVHTTYLSNRMHYDNPIYTKILKK